jgi:hypothetical protein
VTGVSIGTSTSAEISRIENHLLANSDEQEEVSELRTRLQ